METAVMELEDQPLPKQEEPVEQDVDPSSVPLTEAHMEIGLNTLGRSPFNLRYAYLAVDAANLGLTDISLIRDYRHLETVRINHNALTNLNPLASLPYLTALDASHNELSSHDCALGFKPPKCDSLSSWNEGDKWVGSTLTSANLSHNRLTSIGVLYWHKNLRTLNLSHNAITRIAGLEGLGMLTVLRMGHNAIAKFEGLEGLPLTELDLSHNQIDDLAGLEGLAQLQQLDVSHNLLTSLAPLASQQALKSLHAGHNRLQDIGDAAGALTPLRFLLRVTLDGNPLREQAMYREQVLVRTQQIVCLDGEAVTHKEKVHALNVHGQDVANRLANFAKHFPGAPFVNHLPPLPAPPSMGQGGSEEEEVEEEEEEEEEQQEQQQRFAAMTARETGRGL